MQKPKLIDILFRCEFQFDIAKIILTLTGHPFIMNYDQHPPVPVSAPPSSTGFTLSLSLLP